MGKSLNGKELGNGISQRKDGLYQARFINRFGKRQTIYAKTLNEVRHKLRTEQYNDEKALSYTVSLALYAARNFYQVYREFPSGSGFADIVYLPRKGFLDKPALIVELKWNKSAEGAIQQILKKQYFQKLEDYSGNMLLVGSNYDLKTRKHECKILEFKK